MKKLLILLSLTFLWSCNDPKKNESENTEEPVAHEHGADQNKESEKKPLSPRTASMVNVGDNHVHIDYGSPGKRGRMIFGGLVGYGQVWATGAHKATFINFGKDVVVQGIDIPAGKYGLFTIPGKEEWTVIINKDWDMHLADNYDESNDLVRIKATPTQLDEVVESLTFDVVDNGEGKGTISIKWDQTEVSFELSNK